MPDVIDKMFGEVGEFYPGSKKKRRPKSGEQKKVNNEKELWQEKMGEKGLYSQSSIQTKICSCWR